MSLVEAALRLTPEQRLEEHQHALDLILEIESAPELRKEEQTERSKS
jgi:hypothetical protein